MTATREKVRTSRVILFDNCPQAYAFSLRVTDYDTHAQARGTIFHEFAQRVLLECRENEDDGMPTGYARDLMLACIRDSGLPIPAKEHDTLLLLATEFVATRTFDTRFLIDTEENYRLEIGPLVITGRPDRVELEGRELRIWDYKTGWAIDTDAAVRGTAQGRIYGRMGFDTFPQVERVRLLWDYPRWGATPREHTLTRDDLPEIDAYLESLAKRIIVADATGEYAATPGSWCQYCPDVKACPIPDRERGDGSITTGEQALAAGELVLALEAQVKETKAALRAHCAEHGPVEVGDLTFDFSLTSDSDRVIDKDLLRAAMEVKEIEWASHFRRVKGSTMFKARKAPRA